MIVWEVIVWAIILIVVAVILIYVFKNTLGRQEGAINTQIDSAKDSDGDGVPNVFDKCCRTDKDYPGSSVDASGCVTNSISERTSCENRAS